MESINLTAQLKYKTMQFIIDLIMWAFVGLLFYPIILFYIVCIYVAYMGIRYRDKGKKSKK